ncbi:BlaI/MecI/CopY family transcriptional regulator [Edaphobacter flagellatus]|uniref:BlaI/MecI/CopY family transcriptional regulator n=1 Tax=Edaphobacter flagellatus TaxID=1933044 RepID=UPI0021B1FF3C|nr:BlaI/MecI/CopY family transcriptional regulator [Edaphobacter flagellatus]
MTKKKETTRPTEGELEILAFLWERGSATVREVYEAISASRPMVYTGILKLMQIMTDKGLVIRDESARAHVYRANVAKEETERRFVRELSQRLFSGSAAQLALRALEIEPASEEQLVEIRKLLARKKQEANR